MPLERLQKIIAAAGIASRRKAEELISSGHVQVNGTVVTELGSKADPETRPRARQRQASAGRAAAHLSSAQQAQGICHHHERSGKAADGDGPDSRREGPRLSRRTAGLRQRRTAAADQRWRSCAPPDESGVACGQDLCRESCGHARRKKRSPNCAREFPSRPTMASA